IAMRRFLLFAVALGLLASPVLATDLRNVVGVGWWGFPGPGYWFPASLQWCVDGSGTPYLVSTPCVADTITQVDDLAEGADRLLGAGSRVIYVPLNANPISWFKYNNPHFQQSIFAYAPADRLTAAAQRPPYSTLFQKGFSTFILAVGDNVPVCHDAGNFGCDCGTAGCTEDPTAFGLEG